MDGTTPGLARGKLLCRPSFQLRSEAEDEKSLFRLRPTYLGRCPFFDVLLVRASLSDVSYDPIGRSSVAHTEGFREIRLVQVAIVTALGNCWTRHVTLVGRQNV